MNPVKELKKRKMDIFVSVSYLLVFWFSPSDSIGFDATSV